jgi:signal transduction histidine kinase
MSQRHDEPGPTRGPRAMGRHLPLLVLFAGLAATALASATFLRTVRERDRLRFSNAVEATEDRVRGRVETYVTLLRAGSGLIATDPQLRRAEFRAYVDGLELRARYPAVQALGFAVVVPKDGRSRVLDEMRELPDVRFDLWPKGAREERTAIVWIEPFDARNRVALGFDLATEPLRREALLRARDAGGPAVSGRVTLVQAPDAPEESGFLLFLPIYSASPPPTTVDARRASLLGWIYGALRADELFRGLFGSERNPRIAVAVYDGERLDDEHAIHRSDTSGDDPGYVARFTRGTTLDVAGRRWTIQFRTRPAFEEAPSERMVAIGAVIGAALSLVLFGATRAQRDARREAERRYREARDALEARDVFLSIASHELKTPLTSLKIHAQRLLRRAGAADLPALSAEEIAARAHAMDLQATRLNGLVDELLDVSRITAGRMRFVYEPVDLTALARDVVDRFASPLASVSGELHAVGEWDRMRLDQVVTNLVSNALKYGEGKPVSVRVEATETRARLVVEDHGLGIAKEHQARLFERFERFVSERHFGGFGLGLWISRQIVEGLGGTITVQSEPGRGSTFVVDLPRSAAPQHQARAERDA